jgi:regulatory protein
MKLRQLGEAEESAQEKIIAQLVKKRFLDEARYARAFALDKFNLHDWGKVKIEFALREKNIPDKLIDAALQEINSRTYEQTLKKLFKKKSAELGKEDAFQKKGKLASYLIGKGYEADIVWTLIEQKG